MADPVDDRSKQDQEVSDAESDQYHKKLQRILRSSDLRNQHLSGGVSPLDRRRVSEQQKEAALSPRLINPSSILLEDEPLFQCTECDMIVKESDPYCPFCGAIFADGPLATEEAAEPEPEVRAGKPRVEKPIEREEMVRPQKFDLFGMLKTRSRSRDLMYQEALKGFQGSARLLEEIERLISDINSLGTDTTNARRLMSSAWEACRDGDWNLVSTLARQTEEVMAPSIPDLVRSEISRAREYLTEAKAADVDISQHVLTIKSAMQALHAGDYDEALRITKELMDSIREDSISWR